MYAPHNLQVRETERKSSRLEQFCTNLAQRQSKSYKTSFGETKARLESSPRLEWPKDAAMLGSWIGVSEACVYRAVKTFRGPSFAYHSIVFGPEPPNIAHTPRGLIISRISGAVK